MEELSSIKLVEGDAVAYFRINPFNSNHFVCTRQNHIFSSLDKGLTWTEITPDYNIYTEINNQVTFTDIEFGIGNKILISSYTKVNGTSANCIWTDNIGATWNKIDFSGFYQMSDNLTPIGQMHHLSSHFNISSSFEKVAHLNGVNISPPQINIGVIKGILDPNIENYIEKCYNITCTDYSVHHNIQYYLGGGDNFFYDFVNFFIPKGVKFSLYYVGAGNAPNAQQLAFESDFHATDTHYDATTLIPLNIPDNWYKRLKIVFETNSDYDLQTDVWFDNFSITTMLDDFRRIECDLTSNSNYAYFAIDNGSKTILSQSLLTDLNNQNFISLIPGTRPPGGSMMTMESNPTKRIYVNGVRGNFYDLENNLWNHSFDTGHDDNRGIKLIQRNQGDDDVLLMANDGGISKSIDGGQTWEILNGEGLIANQIHGFDVSKDKKDFIIMGQQDGPGGVMFDATGILNTNWAGGDGVRSIFTDNGDFPAYGTGNESVRRYTSINTTQGSLSSPGLYLPYPIVQNPTNVDQLLVGTSSGLQLYDYSNSSKEVKNSRSKPTEIYWCKNNPNIVYASYSEPTYNSSNPSQDVLYKSTDGGNTFQNITFGLNQQYSSSLISSWAIWNNISGIAVDEKNVDRVWVCYDGIAFKQFEYGNFSNSQNRVAYSDDGGDTWVEISEGLPAMPVTDILYYQNGKDDILFAGTDFGVYIKINNQPWECFSNGLPKLFITELKINECAKELYVATYGRGIWKVDISQFSMNALEISSNETWTTDKKIYQNILVKAGNTLNIQSTVSMATNTKIIVEPSARLTLDGGTLTNGCGEMWQGIELQGNRNLRQTDANQGVVVMLNNATVEYATNGINVFGRHENGTIDWSKTGGIVRVNNSNFKNCRRGIEFMSYKNLHPNGSGQEVANTSYITGSTFTTTEELPNNVVPYYGITMYDVNGVNIVNNTFENTRTDLANISYQERGGGIHSMESGYKVQGSYNTFNGDVIPNTGNTFENLDYGIQINGNSDLNSALVRNNTFINNGKAIGMVANGFGKIERNTIHIPQGSTSNNATNGVGILIDNANGFMIAENEFFNLNNGFDFKRGVYSLNSSTVTGGEVYKNTFNNITLATQMEGNNQNLKIDCDDFNRNANSYLDMYHANGNMGSQGDPTGSNPPINNTFNGNCDVVLKSQIYKEATGTNNWSYFYQQNGATIDVNCVSAGITLSQINALNLCPYDFITPVTPKMPIILREKEKVGLLNDQLVQLKQNLEMGNSDALITAIETDNNQGDLKNTLMNASPYLSDRVLIAYVHHNPPPGLLKQVIIANSPVTERVMEEIDQASMPNGIRNQINSAQNGISTRALLQAQADYINAEKIHSVDFVVREYLDTNWVDSAIVFLEAEASPEALCALVPIIIRRDTVKTKTHLESLREIANELEEKEPYTDRSEQVKGFCDFYQELMRVSNRLGGYYAFTPTEIQQLEALSISKTAIASNARSLLNFINETPHEYTMMEPSMGSTKSALTNDLDSPDNISDKEITFTVIPNPSQGSIRITLTQENATEKMLNAQFIIMDFTGKQIAKFSASNPTLHYEFLDVSTGIYMIQLINEGTIIQTQKIVIQK